MNDAIATAKSNILIVDDHPVIRHGLTQLIDQQPDLAVCSQVGTVEQAIEAVERLRPEAAIIDISLDGGDGLELVKQIRARWPEVMILVLSMHCERLYAERALRAGARGYVMKQESPDTVMTALRKVLVGAVHVGDAVQAFWLERAACGRGVHGRPPIEALSDRELCVMRSIGSGSGTRQIAEKLHLSVKTIESHRENIKRKLGLKNATELVRYATLFVEQESNG
jgi:DNA-binding NarL/FixJ family response regulator